jgi:hypothetical protein
MLPRRAPLVLALAIGLGVSGPLLTACGDKSEPTETSPNDGQDAPVTSSDVPPGNPPSGGTGTGGYNTGG